MFNLENVLSITLNTLLTPSPSGSDWFVCLCSGVGNMDQTGLTWIRLVCVSVFWRRSPGSDGFVCLCSDQALQSVGILGQTGLTWIRLVCVSVSHQALQSVGNLGLQLGHGKEQWMAPLHPIILCSVASVKDFLDKLIDIDHDGGKNDPSAG